MSNTVDWSEAPDEFASAVKEPTGYWANLINEQAKIIADQDDELSIVESDTTILIVENNRLEGIIRKRDGRIDNLNKYCDDLERWNDEWRTLISGEMELRRNAEKRLNVLKKELDTVSLRYNALLEDTESAKYKTYKKIDWVDCESTGGEHLNWWFDREICGLCNGMHYVCTACGMPDCRGESL